MKLSDLKVGDIILDKDDINLCSVVRLESDRVIVVSHDVVLTSIFRWELWGWRVPNDKDMVNFISNNIRLHMILDRIFKNPPNNKNVIKNFAKGI